jgi:hypothetical protein
LKLSLGEGEKPICAGDASAKFEQAAPLSFLGVSA